MRPTILVFALLLASPVAAQNSHSQHSGHSGHGATKEVQATETGQSAFAALAEIVAILQADPATDWTKVDIAALRAHLVDMDSLTLGARVTRTPRPDGMRFDVRGTGRVLDAVRRMVPAHAPFLAAETGWQVTTEDLPDGVALIIDGDAAQIRALGFFGVMTIGAHHQEHHLMIARGQSPHH